MNEYELNLKKMIHKFKTDARFSTEYWKTYDLITFSNTSLNMLVANFNDLIDSAIDKKVTDDFELKDCMVLAATYDVIQTTLEDGAELAFAKLEKETK